MIPASYYGDRIIPILREFDAIVLMKVGAILPQLINILEQENLIDKSIYIERATSQDERIVHNLKGFKQDKCVYFSMIIVNKKLRSGVLQGKVNHVT